MGKPREKTRNWRSLWFTDEERNTIKDKLSLKLGKTQRMKGRRAAKRGKKSYKVEDERPAPKTINGVREGFDAKLGEEIEAMRARATRRALDPTSATMRSWDGLTVFCLLYTSIVTPVEVGFGGAEVRPGTGLFWSNRVIDAVFVMDIFVQFDLAYLDEHRGNMLIRSRKQIAKRYVQSWFIIDVLSSVPIDVLQLYAQGGSWLSSLRTIRLIRLLRLLKLARVLRASRILTRWESMISISYAHLTIMKLAGMFLLVAHWMACLWGICATARSSSKWTWLDALSETKKDKYGKRHFGKNSMADAYIAAFYFVLYTITGVGYGDLTPANSLEMVVGIVFIVAGGILWAYIIGTFCSILSTVDVYGSQFRQSMDELNIMMEDRGYPSSLRRRCRTFFRQSRNQLRIHNYRKLEGMMSRGTVWGEDFVLENLDLADSTCACALTYIEVLCLSAAGLYQILEYFPNELKAAKVASAFYTVKSQLVRMAREAREASQQGSRATSTFDRLFFNANVSGSMARKKMAAAVAKKRAKMQGNLAAASTLSSNDHIASEIAEIHHDLAHYQEKTEKQLDDFKHKLNSIEGLIRQALNLERTMGKLDVKPSVKASLHVKESIRASKPPNAALQYHKLQSGLGGGLAKLRPLGEDSTKLEAIEGSPDAPRRKPPPLTNQGSSGLFDIPVEGDDDSDDDDDDGEEVKDEER
ncbi:voltage-gated potassium channel [Aureococcus anophagefferens]|nr:voltage-gated potassium channel [Aureococcus anophagefferens]